jgi:hypothetical protein
MEGTCPEESQLVSERVLRLKTLYLACRVSTSGSGDRPDSILRYWWRGHYQNAAAFGISFLFGTTVFSAVCVRLNHSSRPVSLRTHFSSPSFYVLKAAPALRRTRNS